MQKLFELFKEMGYGDLYFRQGSLTDETYPDEFFTFWNIDTPNEAFYDNDESCFIEYIQVGFYTNDASKIYSVMDDFIERAKQKGFILAGRAQDANADKDDYFGRVCYLRIKNKVEA